MVKGYAKKINFGNCATWKKTDLHVRNAYRPVEDV